MWSIFYNSLLYPLIILTANVISLKNKKMKDSIAGKKGLWDRLEKHVKNRDFSKPLIWFHVPSAGEFLQAQPVLERFLNNDFDCAVTFNSISGEKWVKRARIFSKNKPVLMDFLPYDFPSSIRKWIRLIKPSALVFVKFDLWPNTIWQAEKEGIPIFLICATLQPRTPRLTSLFGRSLYGNLYSRFKGIFAVTEDDKQRFLKTKPDLPWVDVLGDTRFDSVINQRDRVPVPDLPNYLKNKRVFVVGSSWPPDEDCIFPVLKEALNKYSDLVLIIAPHEPTEKHLENSEKYFEDQKLARLSKLAESSEENRIILVDSVGVLSSLYHIGYLVYIGGGFTTGVHNVMEPCSMGLPAFFGPFYDNSPEAIKLAKDGLSFSIKDSDEFRQKLFELLDNPEKTKQLGEASREFVESQCGAAEKCFEIISKEINEN